MKVHVCVSTPLPINIHEKSTGQPNVHMLAGLDGEHHELFKGATSKAVYLLGCSGPGLKRDSREDSVIIQNHASIVLVLKPGLSYLLDDVH